MDDPSDDTAQPEPANLRFLRRLVTVLTAVMILGMITVVALLVMRFNQSASVLPRLPDQIVLPEGRTATAVTYGPGWFAIVTDRDEILIYSAEGQLRQTVPILPDG